MTQKKNRTLSSKSVKTKTQPKPFTMQVIVQPSPLPPDFLDRMAQIYALAERRYWEKVAREAAQREKAVPPEGESQ